MNDFNTIWARQDVLDAANGDKIAKSYYDQCTKLELYCGEQEGKFGILLSIGDSTLLVNPIKLSNTIFKDDEYDGLIALMDENHSEFTIKTTSHNFGWQWEFSHSHLGISTKQSYTRQNYVETIIRVLSELETAYNNGEQLLYEDKNILKYINFVAEQCRLFSHLASDAKVRSHQIRKEDIFFDTTQDSFDYSNVVIGCNNRYVQIWIDAFESSTNSIRHQLETIAFNVKADIKLCYDYISDAILSIEEVSVLNEVIKCETGYGYNYDELMKITYYPSEDMHNIPIVQAYCDRRQCVKALYEGFLKMALRYQPDYPNGKTNNVAYNDIKSLILEDYIAGIKRDKNEILLRQKIVKNIIINPKGNVYLYDEDEKEIETYKIYNNHRETIMFTGLEDWAMGKHLYVDENNQFDNDKYYNHGLLLAKELREQLSKDFDLWFKIPNSKEVASELIYISDYYDMDSDYICYESDNIYDFLLRDIVRVINGMYIAELNYILPNPACCECGDFPNETFSNTEVLQLFHEGYAILENEMDVNNLEDELIKIIEQHCDYVLTNRDIDILIARSRLMSGYRCNYDWYVWQLYDDLFTYDDYHTLLNKLNSYVYYQTRNQENNY